MPQTEHRAKRVLRPSQVKHAGSQGHESEEQGGQSVQRPHGHRQIRSDPRFQHKAGRECSHRQLGQHQHHYQRPVRMLWTDLKIVGRQHIARKDARRLVGRRGISDLRVGRRRQEDGRLRVFDRTCNVDHLDRNRLVRTGRDACRRLAVGQSRRTHVALPHDALGRVILWHIVRTCERAILAAETLIVQMHDDARLGVLLVRIDRTRGQARRLDAMVAGGGHVLQHRQRARTADQQTHVAPGFARIQSVQRVAARHASLATAAAIEIHFESVLLPRTRWRRRQERTIELLGCRGLRHVVVPRKALDRRKILLLGKQRVDQGQDGALGFRRLRLSDGRRWPSGFCLCRAGHDHTLLNDRAWNCSL